ncbi:MAG: GFA family protein [Parasphingopyxis sp.]
MSSSIGPLSGQCHCGNVCITVARAPAYINECNCSLCHSLGASWCYFASNAVEISGHTTGYVRGDLPVAELAVHHCPTCGTTTHWVPLKGGPDPRMGVNTRLFANEEMDGIEIRYPDGKSW